MRIRFLLRLWAVAALGLVAVGASAQSFNPGEKLQLLSNLHPDSGKRVAYTINYQQSGLIPVCTEVEVVEFNKKKMIFSWNGVQYQMKYDKHTKKSGVSFEQALSQYFGPACDKRKLAKMSEVDKRGIRTGMPEVGMSREAVILAMGRPPIHANPSVDTPVWTYWLNRFKRKLIVFDDKGKVERIQL